MAEDPFTAARREREAEEAQTKLALGLDGDKDKAAHSLSIASNTGADPGYIYSNYPIATKAYRSSLAQDVVDKDPMLQYYFNSNPLASIVSKDDVANLSSYSDAMREFKDVQEPVGLNTASFVLKAAKIDTESAIAVGARHLAHAVPAMLTGLGVGAGVGTALEPGLGTVGGALVGAGAGMISALAESYAQARLTQAYFPEEAERLTHGEEEHPYAAVAGEVAAGLPFFRVTGGTMTGRAIMATAMAGIEAVQEKVLTGEIDPKHVIGAAIGGAIFGGEVRKPVADLGRMIQTGTFVGKSLENKEMPLGNVYGEWDKVKVEDSKDAMKIWDAVLKAAKGSDTRKISIESFKQLAQQYGDEPVGFTWRAVRRLYGDSMPEAGDGKLGDVPGIEQKFAKSMVTGEDILVPPDDLITLPDETLDALHEDMRVRQDLDTLEETKEPIDTEAMWGKIPPLTEDESQQLINEVRAGTGTDARLEAPIEGGAVMPKREQDQMIRAINEINEKDKKKRAALIKKRLDRERLPAYRKEAAEEHERVLAEIDNRPNFKIWKLFNDGEYQGQKLSAKPRIDPTALTPEQREKFPEHWTAAGGMRPDDLSKFVGVRTGDELIQNAIAYRELKGDRTYEQLKAIMAQAETQRRMEARYGDMDALNTAEAMEHTTGLEEEDLLWSKYKQAAIEAGQEIPLTREDVKNNNYRIFHDDFHREQSLIRYTRELVRSAKEAFRARAKGDFAGAYQARQEIVNKFAMALEAKALDARKRADNRILKRVGKVEVANRDPRYVDWMHYLMLRHQVPTDRIPEHLADTIARPEVEHKTLLDFANSHNIQVDPSKPGDVGLPVGYDDHETTYNPNMPIWDKLLDPSFNKPVKNMNVYEYKAFTNSIRVLDKLAMDKSKGLINIEGVEHNTNDLINKFAEGIDKASAAKNPTNTHDMRGQMIFKRMKASLWHPEYMLDRLVRFDPTSVWHKLFYNPVVRAGHYEQQVGKEVERIIRDGFKELKSQYGIKRNWWTKQVPNDTIFGAPQAMKDELGNYKMAPKGQDLLDLTNEHLVGLAASTGSKDAFTHTALGRRMTEGQLMDYMTRVMRPEHYAAAKVLVKAHSYIQALEDKMTMQRTGMIIEKPPLGKAWTPFGEVDGHYWPRQRDLVESPRRPEVDPHPFNAIKATTDRYWDIQRTGQLYPVRLSLEWLANDYRRRIRYLAQRPIQDIYNKVLGNEVITSLIKKHWGELYNEKLHDYFFDMAGRYGIPSKFEQAAQESFNFLSNNMLVNSIGFNPGTMGKHIPQSIAQSIRNEGFGLVRAAFQMYGTNQHTGLANKEFLAREGELVNRRHFWRQELGPSMDEQMGRIGMMRRAAMTSAEWSVWTLGKTDSVMSNLTFLSRYETEVRARMDKIATEQLTPAEHVIAANNADREARDLAARAVRITHGPTTIASKPELLRSQSAMVQGVSRALNFMLTAYNNRLRAAGIAKDLVLRRSTRPVWQDVSKIAFDMFTYVVLPTLIEDTIDPITSEDDTWLTWGGKLGAQALAAPIPIVRDMVHGWLTGHGQAYGMTFGMADFISRALKEGAKWEDGDMNYGKQFKYAASILGAAYAFPGVMAGRLGEALINIATGEESGPSDAGEMIRLMRWGSTEEPAHGRDRKRLIQQLYEKVME